MAIIGALTTYLGPFQEHDRGTLRPGQQVQIQVVHLDGQAPNFDPYPDESYAFSDDALQPRGGLQESDLVDVRPWDPQTRTTKRAEFLVPAHTLALYNRP